LESEENDKRKSRQGSLDRLTPQKDISEGERAVGESDVGEATPVMAQGGGKTKKPRCLHIKGEKEIGRPLRGSQSGEEHVKRG